VGIGVTPEAWTVFSPVLQIGGGAIAGSSSTNFRIFSNTYYDGAYKRIATGLASQYEQADGNHIWYSNPSAAADSTFTPDEHMRLDTSGNLLVGNTVTNPASGFNNQKGFAYAATTGQVQIATTANEAAMELGINNASDGPILIFRKQSSTFGSIGTVDADLLIHSTASGHGGLRFGNGYIAPTDNSGQVDDNAFQLGLSTHRFTDLYLSGGAYLGGVASANKLDDYEEGTFTLTISSANFTISSQTNTYTKIGNTVSIRGRVTFSAVLSNGSSVVFTGAPFTCTNNIHGVGVARETTTSGDIFTAQLSGGSTNFSFTSMDGIAAGSNQVLLANKNYDYQVTYQV